MKLDNLERHDSMNKLEHGDNLVEFKFLYTYKSYPPMLAWSKLNYRFLSLNSADRSDHAV
jgi:hypothetical protein